MSGGRVQPYRIAIRESEEWVTAFYAPPDSMEGAVDLGRIRKTALQESPGSWPLFVKLWEHVCLGILPDRLRVGATVELLAPPEKQA